jgi:hypothetical protein
MISIISFRAAAGSAAPRPVDLQQEDLAGARWPTLSETDAALANRSFGRRIEDFETCRDEMIFERAGPSCYSDGPFAAPVEQGSAEMHATDDTTRRPIMAT